MRYTKLSNLKKSIAFALWKSYKILLSPLLGSSCRFYPTCSHYAYLLLAHENLARALPKILYRLARCQPFSQGGIEYPTIKLRSIARLHLPARHIAPAHIGRICYWLIPAEAHRDAKSHDQISHYILIPHLGV